MAEQSKPFWIKLTLMILLAAAAISFEWWRLEKRIQAFGPVHGSVELTAKIVKLMQQVPDPKVIIGGDSKAERHLNPQLFLEAGAPAINIAVPSGDLWTLVQTLEALGLHRSRATFLLSAGAYQINDGNIDKDTYTPEQFFSYTPWERLKMFRSAYFLAAHTMLKREYYYQNFPAIVGQIAQSPGQFENLGFLPVDPSDYSCVRVRHNSGASPWSAYKNIATEGARWRLFTEAVKKMESWPGRYVIYNSPVSTKGHVCLDGSYGGDLERAFAAKVTKEVAPLTRVRFVDFYVSSSVPIDDGYFYDPSHLNRHGADIFTRWWIGYLKKEGWLSTSN